MEGCIGTRVRHNASVMHESIYPAKTRGPHSSTNQNQDFTAALSARILVSKYVKLSDTPTDGRGRSLSRFRCTSSFRDYVLPTW